jgi:hypothetical protein
LEKIERQRVEVQGAIASGNIRSGDALSIFRNRLANDLTLKPRSKAYREERIAALLKSWPELEQMEVRKISKHDCLGWLRFESRERFSYFPQHFLYFLPLPQGQGLLRPTLGGAM